MTAADEPRAHEAGQPLDHVVAERAMGWARDHRHLDMTLDRWRLPNGEYRTYGECPYYSTDLAAAWLVVERLRQIGLSVVISDEGDGWEIEVITTEALYHEGYRGCYVQDATVAGAICLAALRVVGEAEP